MTSPIAQSTNVAVDVVPIDKNTLVTEEECVQHGTETLKQALKDTQQKHDELEVKHCEAQVAQEKFKVEEKCKAKELKDVAEKVCKEKEWVASKTPCR